MEELKSLKKVVYWVIGLVFVISAVTWFFSRTEKTIETGIVRYEEFQEINNTITKLNADLCNIKDVSETDKMFEQFSKAQRINTLRGQINRWVEDYNAK